MNLMARVPPSTPSASYVSLFNDSADGHLKIKKSDTSLIDLELGGVGGTGGGGGMAAGGTIQRSGDAIQTVFLIPHGLAPQPDLYWAEPTSDDGIGNRKVTIDATNIIVTYGVPPPSGSLNLTFHWVAGYINSGSRWVYPFIYYGIIRQDDIRR